MIKIITIAGNVFRDKNYLKTDNPEYLLLSRLELEKSRLRRKTDKGTDIGLVLESDTLHNGDILSCDGKNIIVKQLPEKVISIKLKNTKSLTVDFLVLVGHIIGNRHKPISVVDNFIYFPILDDSEFDVFQKLFSNILNNVDLSIKELVFDPLIGANIHEH